MKASYLCVHWYCSLAPSNDPGTMWVLSKYLLLGDKLEEFRAWFKACFNNSNKREVMRSITETKSAEFFDSWLWKINTFGPLHWSTLGKLDFSPPKWSWIIATIFLSHIQKSILAPRWPTPSQAKLSKRLHVFWLLDFCPNGLYYVAITLYAIICFSVFRGNHHANETQSWLKNQNPPSVSPPLREVHMDPDMANLQMPDLHQALLKLLTYINSMKRVWLLSLLYK